MYNEKRQSSEDIFIITSTVFPPISLSVTSGERMAGGEEEARNTASSNNLSIAHTSESSAQKRARPMVKISSNLVRPLGANIFENSLSTSVGGFTIDCKKFKHNYRYKNCYCVGLLGELSQ